MVYAIIMAGGRGKRFWPKSRIKMPKQALHIVDKKKSMIQVTVNRIKKQVSKKNIRIVTNCQQIDLMKSHLSNLSDKNFIVEPDMKNTAACIGLSAVLLEKHDPDAVMIVLPADHMVKDEENFVSNLKAATKVAQNKNALVTFGIKPNYPSVGYGYIEVDRNSKFNIRNVCFYKVNRFTEKPNRKKAKKFFKGNKHFWNSGMFVWKASVVLKSFEFFMPDLYSLLLEIRNVIEKKGFENKLKAIYKKMEDKSIDYGIMEPSTSKNKPDNAPDVYLVNADFGWNDVGSWKSLDDILFKDRNGNVKLGKSVNLESKDSIVISNENHLIGTIGVEDTIIVHTDDATLVCRKKDAQKVKKLLSLMEKKGKFKNYL